MQKLFEYRFKEGGGLRGHNFGNLFIAAMTDITGDFEEAVRQSSKVLAVRGRVLPITLDNVRLCAELDDGSVVTGETRISASGSGIKRVYLEPEDSTPLPEALNAIKEADAIVLGPGSLYTSVLSTLSVPKISQAIAEAPAVKIYVCNVMTQPGETSGYTLERHVQAVLEHAGTKSVDVVLHNSQRVPEEIADRYRAEGSEPVEGSVYKIQQMGLDMVAEDLLSWDGYIRHSSERLAKSIIRIILKHRGHVLRKRVLEMYWLPDWLKG